MLTISTRQLVLLACLMAVLSAGSAALAVTLLQPASADATAADTRYLRQTASRLDRIDSTLRQQLAVVSREASRDTRETIAELKDHRARLDILVRHAGNTAQATYVLCRNYASVSDRDGIC